MSYTPDENRYNTPAGWFRRCGHTGLKLPALSLGCWHNFGEAGSGSAGHASEDAMHENGRRMLHTAFDHGITHFDLANNYGPPPGAAESRVGRILKQDFAAHRDELIISTKAGFLMWPGPYGEWGSRKNILASLDQSLQRLGLDYVDIFYSHRPDPDTPLEETLGALDTAVKSGKALYAGISNYNALTTERSLQLCRHERLTRPIIHQPSYSILNRGLVPELTPVLQTHGMGMIVFCPLAQGLLTDKYLKDIPDDSRAKSASDFLKEDRITDALQKTLQKLNAIAEQRGQSLAQMALAWVLQHPQITSALIGASRPEQITQNLRALDNITFTRDELESIDTLSRSA